VAFDSSFRVDPRPFEIARARGEAAMRGGTIIPGVHRCLHLLVAPSFTPTVSYEVFWSAGRGLVLRRVWDVRADAERLSRPVGAEVSEPDPTIASGRLDVDAVVVERWLARIEQASLPLRPPPAHPPGLDGTGTRLVLGQWSGRIELEWWESGPASWSALVEATHEVHLELDRLPWVGDRGQAK
jgi:hypothetical protein